MDNSTATPLQGYFLLVTQLELVTPTTVDGTLYGIAFTLFCLYVHSLAPRLQDEDRKRQAKFMLGYSSIIMLCGLYVLIVNVWLVQDAYIKHGNYPEGPYAYTLTTYHKPLVIISTICQFALDTLTSAIQIWRVWVIWGATRYANLVIVLPLLCFLTFLALSLRTIIFDATLTAAEIHQLDAKTEIAEIAIQATITILCTMLISLYLVFRHWHQRKLIRKAQGSIGYINVVAMLIESYALESIWGVIIAITWNLAVIAFFIESVRFIQIIAYLLVQYRVARGTAYESQRSHPNISSLYWNHSNHATTHHGETSEICSGPHVPENPETSGGLPAASTA